VKLYYQSTSKEFVEFLRDANTTDNKGQELYELWSNNGKCPPELMAETQIAVLPTIPGDCDGNGSVDLADYENFAACLLGPLTDPGSECECFDLDDDEHVTARDFAVLQVNFSG
jgi:hypothetical protein